MGERWTVYVFALVMKKSGRMCKLLEQSGSIEGVIQPSEHPRGLSNASCIAPEAPSSHLTGSGHHLVLSSYIHNLQGCRNSKVQLGNRDAHGGAKTGDADDQKTRLNACFLTATPSPDCGSGLARSLRWRSLWTSTATTTSLQTSIPFTMVTNSVSYTLLSRPRPANSSLRPPSPHLRHPSLQPRLLHRFRNQPHLRVPTGRTTSHMSC